MRWKILALGLIIVTATPISLIGYEKWRNERAQEDVVVGTGTIVWLDFEGGFWGIVGDDGKHYDPINLDSEFRSEDLRVYFEAKICTNQASFHMWGIIVEILKIQKLE